MEHEKHDCCQQHESKKSVMRTYLVPGMVALILIIVVFQSFQINAMKGKFGANSAASSGGKLDMSGWSAQEKMEYEHHGIVPARLGGSQQQSSGMVGGC